MKKTLTKLLFLLVLVLAASSTYAQRMVSGKVTDSKTGEPLIGANVLVKGTSNGTITDVDGNYSLRTDVGSTLVISYTGYADQEFEVGESGNVDVSLDEGSFIDEVVVVGYGSQKEKEITSAVVSVSNKEFNKGPISDPAQLLQGKVAGLQVYNRGGDPNRTSVIRLRGLSTVGANVEPLVVIDGIVGASLANVDPNDIQSIDVLKDGSAAAIYGTRGSSGVILVTTKKGKSSSGISVGYNGQLGVSSPVRAIEVMTAEEFVAAGGTDLGAKTDWLSEVTRSGLNNNHGLSAEGGSGSTNYRISANTRSNDGILKKSGFDQFNTRLKLGTRALNDKLSIDFNTSFTNKKQQFGFDDALRYSIIYNPTAPIFGKDSKYPFNAEQFGGFFETLGLFDSFNPVSILEQNRNDGKRREFNYGANLGYSLRDNLTLNFRLAQQNNTSNTSAYYPTTSHFRGNATSPTRKGLAEFYNDESTFKLYETYATHISSFGSTNLTLTGGYSFQQNNFNSTSMSVGDFPNGIADFSNLIEVSQDLQKAGLITLNSDVSPDEKIIAFFGRANATFDDAIFVNASLRREGSTKLGEGNKWGLFPSIGAGVDLNKYFEIASLNLFKLRVGYGVTGALPGQNGLSKPIRRINNAADGTVTTQLVRAANPDLKWEEKGEINVGVEVGTGRLRSSVDLYSRDIKDFILERAVDAAVFGVNRRFENAGKLNTKGVELALDYDLIKGSGTNYTTGIVFSTYKTKLIDFVLDAEMRADLGAPGQNGTKMVRVKKGDEIGNIWGPIFAGVDDKGSPKYEDINGDGVIVTGQDKALDPSVDFAVLGNGIPDFELGWNNNIEVKGWTINAFFRGAFGHSLVNSFRAFYEPQVATQSSYNFMNTSLKVDGLTDARFSSLYVEKADFFKLDNFTISRNIGLGSIKAISNLNVALTGQNLFVLTGYTGADPEPALVDYGSVDNGARVNLSNPDVLAPGIDRRNNYFAARSFTLGVNFNF